MKNLFYLSCIILVNLYACSGRGKPLTATSSTVTDSTLTKKAVREALFRIVQTNPKHFPEYLAALKQEKLPIHFADESEIVSGGIKVNVSEKKYSFVVMYGNPKEDESFEYVYYEGKFIYKSGQWTATIPNDYRSEWGTYVK